MSAAATRLYANQLWILFGLFAVRVAAQPLALIVPGSYWPPFEAWHSAALPYPMLLASQLMILAVLGRTAWLFSVGSVTPRPGIGVLALALGAMYFGAMMLRLLLGFTALRDHRWFASPLPTVFHLVLAYALLLFGYFHFRHSVELRNGR